MICFGGRVIRTLKVKPQKVLFIMIGLLYIAFLFISFFIELYPLLMLRSPYLGDMPNINLLPFKTILTYILNFDYYNLSILLSNILGNIMIFLPLGIIAPILFSGIYRYKHIIYISISIRTVIEILQCNSSLGVFDIDDIILSIIGGVIGLYLYFKFLK